MGLPEDSGLRESLTKKPPEGMRQLMRRIEEYKRLKDDRLQSKGKVPMMNRPRQTDFPFRPQGGLTIQEPAAQMGEVNVTLKELVHRILDWIKHEPYFRWPKRWEETHTRGIRIYTALIIGTRVILPSSVRC